MIDHATIETRVRIQHFAVADMDRCSCGWTPNVLSPRSDDQIARHIEAVLWKATQLAERDARIVEVHGPGQVTMEQCSICGRLEWGQTAAPVDGESPGVTITVMLLGRCPRCEEIKQRAPEIFAWVCGVVSFHTKDESL